MTITIYTTRNGWVVYKDLKVNLESPSRLAEACWSFTSIDKAIATIRELLREAPGGQGQGVNP